MLAAKEGHLAMAELLLERRAAVDTQNNAGRTALHLAATMQRESMVSLLLGHGANVEIEDAEGRSASDHAKRRGSGGKWVGGRCYDMLLQAADEKRLARAFGGCYGNPNISAVPALIQISPVIESRVVTEQKVPPTLAEAEDVASIEDTSAVREVSCERSTKMVSLRGISAAVASRWSTAASDMDCGDSCDEGSMMDEEDEDDFDDVMYVGQATTSASPLAHLLELGFDQETALAALAAAAGNVQDAVEMLLNGTVLMKIPSNNAIREAPKEDICGLRQPVSFEN
jgi:hypothetical protein